MNRLTYLFIALCLLFTQINDVYGAEVCVKNKKEPCFTVEIADTNKLRQKGLMYRFKLPKDRGMLFEFEKESTHTFWMKNTWISLDIIWINQSLEIVDIVENAKSCYIDPCPTYTPDQKGLYVLEVNAGLVQKLNIQKSQLISIKK
jgi:uncharacterized protein